MNAVIVLKGLINNGLLRDPYFNALRQKYGLVPPIAALLAIMRRESGFKEDAWNPDGAFGLIQFRRKTIRDFQKKYSLPLWTWAGENTDASLTKQIPYITTHLVESHNLLARRPSPKWRPPSDSVANDPVAITMRKVYWGIGNGPSLTPVSERAASELNGAMKSFDAAYPVYKRWLEAGALAKLLGQGDVYIGDANVEASLIAEIKKLLEGV